MVSDLPGLTGREAIVRADRPARLARPLAAGLLVAVSIAAVAEEYSAARAIEMSLAVEEPSPVLAVTRSAVTTVTFLDATGSPWPIASLHVSADAPVAVREPTHPHVATLRTDARRASGNVVAFLEGLDEPVHLALARDAPAAARVRITITRSRGSSGSGDAGASELAVSKDAIGEAVRDYLLANPHVIAEATDPNRRLAGAVRRLRADIVRQPHVPVGGDADGSVTVVEFFDYSCGYCKRSLDAAKAALARSGVRVEFREYPILGEASLRAASLALAADLQGRYIEAHTALMGWPGDLGAQDLPEALASAVGLDASRLRADMESPEVATRIEANRRLAGRLGVTGTPAFLFLGPNAVDVVPGAMDAGRMTELIASVEGTGSANRDRE